MNNNQKKELCLKLMRADSEAEIVQILTEVGFWENKRVWRLYGDRENNFSTIGNQQNRPDAALVEKLINSVDARLMHECLARGINPESPAAPQNIRESVARFFEGEHPIVFTVVKSAHGTMKNGARSLVVLRSPQRE